MTGSLCDRLTARMGPSERAWLDDALSRVAADPDAIAVLFAAAGRGVGRSPLEEGADPGDPHAWTLDDAARVLLLAAVGPGANEHVGPLYRHGDTAERRAVLRALDTVDVGDAGVPLVEDALRTNDPRLVAAGLGAYALRRLPDSAVEHAVLKFVFMGIPLPQIDRLDERLTPRLSRMLAAFVHERVAAGRDVSPEVWPLIARHPPAAELAAIEAELEHAEPARRRAARAALAQREAHA